MSFLSKSAYKFNTTSIRKMAGFLIEVDWFILKFI
jgi:hypothetical protein